MKTLSDQYTNLGRSNQSLKTIIENQANELPAKKRKVDDYQTKLARNGMLVNYKSQSRRLFEDLAWAYVIEKEHVS